VKPERDVQKHKALRERWWQNADNIGSAPGMKGLAKSNDEGEELG
jgi:hypothetical protein